MMQAWAACTHQDKIAFTTSIFSTNFAKSTQRHSTVDIFANINYSIQCYITKLRDFSPSRETYIIGHL